jgi:hypothetical protein
MLSMAFQKYYPHDELNIKDCMELHGNDSENTVHYEFYVKNIHNEMQNLLLGSKIRYVFNLSELKEKKDY